MHVYTRHADLSTVPRRLVVDGAQVLDPDRGKSLLLRGFNWFLPIASDTDGDVQKQLVPGSTCVRTVGTVWDNYPEGSVSDCRTDDAVTGYIKQSCIDDLEKVVLTATNVGLWVILTGWTEYAAGQSASSPNVFQNLALRAQYLATWRYVTNHFQRDWIVVRPGPFDKSCFEVSKRMIKLLRHDSSVLREEDGAVENKTLAQMFRSEFASPSYWSIRTWLSDLQRGGGGPKKRFQHCVDPFHADTIQYLRAIQGQSGGKHIKSTLQDNMLLPDTFAEHIHHVGSSHDMHSIIQLGWPRRQEREACGVHYGRGSNFREQDYDMTQPRIAVYKHNWKIRQNTLYGCYLRVERDHPEQHCTCDMYRKGGGQEVRRRIVK